MIRKSKRLDVVRWLAANSERNAAEKLLASGREVEEINRMLEQLLAGREEYVERLTGGNSMGVAQMRELRGFINKLDDAIAQLQAQLAHKEQLNTKHREHWQGEKRRSKAIDGVVDRYRRAEANADEQRLQREIDDRPPRREL
jgi:flagellar export protein FliJ